MVDEIYIWYRRHQRDLPWRATRDPYRIWVSEVILQQTRISQGLPYYFRFIEKFPRVEDLASASEDVLLKTWEGLGYYSRARNMLEAARTIVSRHNGAFPDSYEEIRNLKGVGGYTAAAVASIAFGLPYAAVDGNVIRFLSRYFGVGEPYNTGKGRKVFDAIAGELLLRDNPGFHNEAIMEFGALCCVPGKPDCAACPVNLHCVAFRKGKVLDYPVKGKKPPRRVRHFSFFIFESEGRLLLEKRTANDIWKDLWQFPVFETAAEVPDHQATSLPYQMMSGLRQPVVTDVSPTYSQVLTHQEVRARFIRVRVAGFEGINQGRVEVNRKEIHTFAYPVLIRKYLEEFSLWDEKP